MRPGASQGQPLRVCYFGTYRADYTRNRILVAGLRAHGTTVVECHSPLWRGFEDREAVASGAWLNPAFWLRVVGAYLRLLWRYRAVGPYDVMLVGYPGQLDVYLGWLLTRLRRRPLVLDVLMSLHLVAEERGLTAKAPRTARLLFALEKQALRLPDLLFIEGDAYRGYLCRKYGLPEERFFLVPHGADDRLFQPRGEAAPDGRFRVTYHGLFLPSHGVRSIVEAAALLRAHPDIHFDFYGRGPGERLVRELVDARGLGNVTLHGFVPFDVLVEALGRSDLVLGVFGTTRHSIYTIQNKVWEGLAMARPVVTADSDAVRQSLRDGEEIQLVPRDAPKALAEAILALYADPAKRARLAARGHARFCERHSPPAIGRHLLFGLKSVIATAQPVPAVGR